MRVSYQGKAVAEVDSLPGCAQVAVVHASFVSPEFQGKGVGKRAHNNRLALLKDEFLYDAAIATVCYQNGAQMNIMRAAGWTQAGHFLSRKTGNTVAIFVKQL